MKKVIIAIAICLFPLKVMSASFVETLGAECARILFQLEVNEYPQKAEQLKNRNSQFYALEQCLKVYNKVGGDTKELNRKYYIAKTIIDYDFNLCVLNKKKMTKACEHKSDLLKNVINQSPCDVSGLIKKQYPEIGGSFKSYIEMLCKTHIGETFKNFEVTEIE